MLLLRIGSTLSMLAKRSKSKWIELRDKRAIILRIAEGNLESFRVCDRAGRVRLPRRFLVLPEAHNANGRGIEICQTGQHIQIFDAEFPVFVVGGDPESAERDSFNVDWGHQPFYNRWRRIVEVLKTTARAGEQLRRTTVESSSAGTPISWGGAAQCMFPSRPTGPPIERLLRRLRSGAACSDRRSRHRTSRAWHAPAILLIPAHSPLEE